METVSTGATTIMIIRHAEKPGTYSGASFDGVDSAGKTCCSAGVEHLITIGWSRAGGLVTLFSSPWGPKPGLAIPAFLYASDPTAEQALAQAVSSDSKSKTDGPSQRPYETLIPLAANLETAGNPISINATFKKKDYPKMIADALNCPGAVLISWQHQDIPLKNSYGQPGLSQVILTQTGTQGNLGIPTSWPTDSKGNARYDLVFVFNRPSGRGPIASFEIIAQRLLSGDEAAPPCNPDSGK